MVLEEHFQEVTEPSNLHSIQRGHTNVQEQSVQDRQRDKLG